LPALELGGDAREVDLGGGRLLQGALRRGGIGVERASHLAVVGERVQRAGNHVRGQRPGLVAARRSGQSW
jgi:hypothetical protein